MGLIPRASKVLGEIGEIRFEEGEKRPERLFFSTVRGSGDENEVAIRVLSKPLYQSVSLMAAAPLLFSKSARVSLIDDN
jgi:hypothetical protein